MADVLLDALLCLSALIPARIGKEGLILQGVVESLGVLSGRQSCYEKKESEGKHLPSQRTIEVILLYHEALPQDTLITDGTTQQQRGTKKLSRASRNACVPL